VRMFQDERDRTTLLIADFRAPMLWGTRRALRSVAAAEHLSLAGWRAIAEGGRVGLMAIGTAQPLFVPARGRDRAMISVVGGLAQAHRAVLEEHRADPSRKPEPLDRFLRMAEQVAPRGTSVVLASSLDEPGAEWKAAMTALAHRTALSVLYMRDAFEHLSHDGAYPFQTDSGRRGLGLIRGRAKGKEEEVVSQLHALDIPVHVIETARAPGEQAVEHGHGE